MGMYLEWKALWQDSCQTQARANATMEGNQRTWTFELLTGQGQHAANQTDYHWGAYAQISASGTNTININFTASYILSKRLTLSAYFDHQVNSPIVTTSAYPTTNSSYGISLNLNLAR